MGHHYSILHNAVPTSTLQFSRREMLALGSILLLPKASSAAPEQYDILGLRLNMTAAEAQQILAERLNAKPKQEGYLIFAGNPRYVVNRRYTSGISFKPLGPNSGVWKVPELDLGLNFAEVYPGEGKGPEALWNIEYGPRLETDASKKDFMKSVLDKFGRPTAILNGNTYYWADRDYGAPLYFDTANVPVLQLDTFKPHLKLSNFGIQKHMEDVYNSQLTKKATPL